MKKITAFKLSRGEKPNIEYAVAQVNQIYAVCFANKTIDNSVSISIYVYASANWI